MPWRVPLICSQWFQMIRKRLLLKNSLLFCTQSIKRKRLLNDSTMLTGFQNPSVWNYSYRRQAWQMLTLFRGYLTKKRNFRSLISLTCATSCISSQLRNWNKLVTSSCRKSLLLQWLLHELITPSSQVTVESPLEMFNMLLTTPLKSTTPRPLKSPTVTASSQRSLINASLCTHFSLTSMPAENFLSA